MTKKNEVEELAKELRTHFYLKNAPRDSEYWKEVAYYVSQHYHPKVKGEVVVEGEVRIVVAEGEIEAYGDTEGIEIFPLNTLKPRLTEVIEKHHLEGKQAKIIIQPKEE